MKNDNYISDQKLDEIRKKYAEKIAMFSNIEKQLLQWYEGLDIDYPASCVNNYRDSWFHYRQIWKERSFYEITCQMATFDEHLQRAEKDAIVSLLQTVSQRLEYWYLMEHEMLPSGAEGTYKLAVEKLYSASTSEDQVSGVWIFNIWDTIQDSELQKVYGICYAVLQYYLNVDAKRICIQKILHKIKNATLRIRFGASDIHRIDYPGEYVRAYEVVYEELCQFFQEEQVCFFLVGMTKVVQSTLAGKE